MAVLRGELGLFSIPICVLVTKNFCLYSAPEAEFPGGVGKKKILRKEEQGYEHFFKEVQRFVCEKSSCSRMVTNRI